MDYKTSTVQSLPKKILRQKECLLLGLLSLWIKVQFTLLKNLAWVERMVEDNRR